MSLAATNHTEDDKAGIRLAGDSGQVTRKSHTGVPFAQCSFSSDFTAIPNTHRSPSRVRESDRPVADELSPDEVRASGY